MPKNALKIEEPDLLCDISPSLMDALERIAVENGISISEALKIAVELGIHEIDNAI